MMNMIIRSCLGVNSVKSVCNADKHTYVKYISMFISIPVTVVCGMCENTEYFIIELYFLFQTCNFVGFICIKVSWSWISAIFYNILYWVANIITLFLLLAYTIHFVEKFNRWPWHKLECFYCVIVVLTYFGCSIFAATLGESVGYAVMVS